MQEMTQKEEMAPASHTSALGEIFSGAKGMYGGNGATAIAILAYVMLPNLPFIVFGHFLGLRLHGYINLVAILIGAMAVLLPRPLVFLLLFIEYLGTAVYMVCYTYFLSSSDLWTLRESIFHMPGWRLVELAVALPAFALLSYFLAFPMSRISRGFARTEVLVAIAVLIFSIDSLAGHNNLMHRYTPLKNVAVFSKRLSLTPIVNLYEREKYFGMASSSSMPSSWPPMRSASAQALAWLGNHDPASKYNLVLVVVESWGQSKDTGMADSLTSDFRDARITARYDVTQGLAPFDGPTVYGEARELCQADLRTAIINTSRSEAAGCLPQAMHQKGYESIALHGYVGKMFDRDKWYKNLGFDQILFGSDLAFEGMPSCGGAFSGICDAAISQWIGNSLVAPNPTSPKFIYWMTLNSHLPTPAHPDLPADQTCSTLPALQESADLCSWYRLVKNVHHSVSDLAVSTQDLPTVFVLVGDHAPPFSDDKLRALFSATEVPYLILTPKQR